MNYNTIRHHFFIKILFCFFILNCTACHRKVPKWKEQILSTLTEEQKYFCEVALSSEFGKKYHKVRKWNKDIHIFVTGVPSPYLEKELREVLSELNAMISDIQLVLVKKPEQANIKLLFGAAEDYVNMENHARSRVKDNWGLVYVFPNWRGEIKHGTLYIDVFRAKDEVAQRHLLREELTQSLGLLNDSWAHRESIFYQGWTTTTHYSDLDRKMIKMLYDERIKPGMKFKKVVDVLQTEQSW